MNKLHRCHLNIIEHQSIFITNMHRGISHDSHIRLYMYVYFCIGNMFGKMIYNQIYSSQFIQQTHTHALIIFASKKSRIDGYTTNLHNTHHAYAMITNQRIYK